jgi:protein-disulfide isomerase
VKGRDAFMNSGYQVLAAAVVLAVAIVVAALLVKSGIDSAAERLTGIESAVGQATGALQRALGPAPPPARAAGPDPNRRYELPVGESPTLGTETAKVTIFEFSDFQ